VRLMALCSSLKIKYYIGSSERGRSEGFAWQLVNSSSSVYSLFGLLAAWVPWILNTP
jgi:hypothetical protein